MASSGLSLELCRLPGCRGISYPRDRERWPAIDRGAAPELPAATAGQEEADEEVVLRRGIDVYEPEHECLE
jgi:hypothetical protein